MFVENPPSYYGMMINSTHGFVYKQSSTFPTDDTYMNITGISPTWTLNLATTHSNPGVIIDPENSTTISTSTVAVYYYTC